MNYCRAVAIIAMVMVVACAGESNGSAENATPPMPQRPQETLIDHFQWTEAALLEDPFANQRPANVRCTEEDWFSERVESNGVTYTEVATATCNYLTLTQPALVDVTKGEPLSILAWHGDLVGLDRAEGVMALALGDTVIWEIRHNIPGFQRVYKPTLESPLDAPAGTPIYFHVRNHGVNSWNLLEFKVGASVEE